MADIIKDGEYAGMESWYEVWLLGETEMDFDEVLFETESVKEAYDFFNNYKPDETIISFSPNNVYLRIEQVVEDEDGVHCVDILEEVSLKMSDYYDGGEEDDE